MRITFLTTFPEMFAPLHASILGRAERAGLLEIREVDIRAYAKNKHRNTDDAPFGGGAGMVMLAQPIVDAVRDVQGENFRGRRIYLSPRGERLTQRKAEALAKEEALILLCGHYEGVDQRAIDLVVDEESSTIDVSLDVERARPDILNGIFAAIDTAAWNISFEKSDDLKMPLP